MLQLFLAPGFEEIETIATLDILRRCGLDVVTVSIAGKRLIHGAHGIPVMADVIFKRAVMQQSQGCILPGGMPGAKNLMEHDALRKAILQHGEQQRPIAAICAAPMALGEWGLLQGRRATCYPGFEKHLKGATLSDEPVVRDGHIITAKGPAYAVDFAFAIAERFLKPADLQKIKAGMLLPED